MTPAERIAAIRARLAVMDGKTMRAEPDTSPGIAGHITFVTVMEDGEEADGPWEMWTEHAALLANAPADLAWLADLAERYGKALERIGPDEFPRDSDDECRHCFAEADDIAYFGKLAVHDERCPWRIAREALEAE